jgi:hypothetical protein
MHITAKRAWFRITNGDLEVVDPTVRKERVEWADEDVNDDVTSMARKITRLGDDRDFRYSTALA